MDAFPLPQVVAYCFLRTREDIHGEHCKNCRLGSSEGYVPRVLCGRGGKLCAVEDVEAQPGSAFLRGAGRAALHGGDGDMHGWELVVPPSGQVDESGGA